MARFARGTLAACMALAIGSGCTFEQHPLTPDAGDPLYVNRGPNQTQISGFVWDPEAFWFDTAECQDPECPPPLLATFNPIFALSLVQDARVKVVDPAQTQPLGTAADPSGPDGSFDVAAIDSRTTPVYLSASGGGPAPYEGDPLPLPPVPDPGAFLPTLSYRPLVPSYSHCVVQMTPVISQKGILQALAKYLTSKGRNTSVADLTNPAKFRGVAVWWLMSPGLVIQNVPASDTTVHASQGSTVNLAWSEPGDAPSPKLIAIQSERGFYVDDSLETSPIGLSVTYLLATASSSTVAFTPEDPVEDETQGRPWSLPPMTFTLNPGEISFSVIPFLGTDPTTGGTGEEAPWLCLPSEE